MQPRVSPRAIRDPRPVPPGSSAREHGCRGAGGVPEVPGGDPRGAHYTGWDECIYGCPYGPGQGRDGAKNSARTVLRAVPEPVPEQCHNRHTPPDTPDT